MPSASNLLQLRLAFALTLAVLWAMLAGCKTGASSGRGLFVTQETVTPVAVTLPSKTNLVQAVSDVVTIGAGGKTATNTVTNIVEQIIPSTITTNWRTNKVVVVNPKVESTIDTIKTVNEVANPMPWANVVSGVLGLGATGLAWIARLKTQKLNQTSNVLDTVIQGVELANSDEVKGHIQRIARAAGTERDLFSRVKAIT